MKLISLSLPCAVSLAALALGPGCGGTETGNPTLPAAELRIAAFSNDFPNVAIGTPGPGLTLTRAFVALDRVVLLPCSGSDPPLDFVPLGVDLTQKPPLVLTTEGTPVRYCGARIMLAPDAGGSTPELAGRSVLVQGTRADGAPFEISSLLDLTVDLYTSPPNTPFSVDKLILAFNFATWLSGVDVAGATVDAGLVTIDETHNPDTLTAFEAQAAIAPALYDDADGNGQLAGDNQPPTAGP